MSNFAFLQVEWPLLHESATRAENLAHTDAQGRLLLRPAHAGTGHGLALQA